MTLFPQNPYLRSLVSGLLVSCGMGMLVLLLELLGFGSWVALLFLITAFTAIFGAISIFGCIFQKTRTVSIKNIIYCVVFVLGSMIFIKQGWVVRQIAFERLAERSEQVITAIKKYESDNGVPPESLYALIPKYLEKYPKTGMPAYSEYKYRVFKPEESETTLYWYDLGNRNGKPISGLWKYVDGIPTHAILALEVNKSGEIINIAPDRLPANIANEKFDAEKWKVNQNRIEMVNSFVADPALKNKKFQSVKSILGEPNGNRMLIETSWELLVECSSGIMNWDVFFYWPTEKYPKHAYGGSIQKISNWAYVHE